MSWSQYSSFLNDDASQLTQRKYFLLSFDRFDRFQLSSSNIVLGWAICSDILAMETLTDFMMVLNLGYLLWIFADYSSYKIKPHIRNCGQLSVEVWWNMQNLIGSTEVCVNSAVVWQNAWDAPQREKTGRDGVPKIFMLHFSKIFIRWKSSCIWTVCLLMIAKLI